MAFLGQKDFLHTEQARVGVLITNLGTPEAPTASALRKYLAQFLSDPRVVEIPRLLWKCILHGVILRTRPRRSAQAYAQVWTDQGSPLMFYTQEQCEALRESLQKIYGQHIVVEFAMRYGKPSIADTLTSLQQQGVRKLLVLPLYPQYSATTTASTFDAVAQDFSQRRWLPDLRFVSHYHDFSPYIEALANSVEAHWKEHGRADKLLLSYHGIPLRNLKSGDPYHCECHKTSRLLSERLGLSDNQFITSFQSRFGRAEWLTPYTDSTLKSLPSQGVESVDVICPGFSADCLETLEEIAEENREYFIAAGGKRYHYIPALNATPDHIAVLTQLLEKNLQGWDFPEDDSAKITQKNFEKLSKTTR